MICNKLLFLLTLPEWGKCCHHIFCRQFLCLRITHACYHQHLLAMRDRRLYTDHILWHISRFTSSGGSKGAPPACPPPLRTKIFLISCSFSEILANLYAGAPVLEGWRPLLWGIPDPPLTSIDIQKDTEIAYPLLRRGKKEIEKCILSYVCVQKITVVTKSPQLRISPHRRNVIFRNENHV